MKAIFVVRSATFGDDLGGKGLDRFELVCITWGVWVLDAGAEVQQVITWYAGNSVLQ